MVWRDTPISPTYVKCLLFLLQGFLASVHPACDLGCQVKSLSLLPQIQRSVG